MNKKKPQQKLLHPQNISLREFFNLDRIFLITFTKKRRKFLTRTAILFTKIGNGQLWLLCSLIAFIYYVPLGFAVQAAILIQLHIQIFLKHLIKRARPYHTYKDLDYLYPPPDPYSFPSGHTCAAFTMAFVSKIAFPVVFPFFLTIALIIAFSRIYLAVHYPSDVFAGTIIAYFSAKVSLAMTTLVTGIVL